MSGSWLRGGLWKPLLVSLLLVTCLSCGTILHPERRGQPPGRIDPGIAVLDGIGLLLFFVPGVIAFAVDFSTGAIYLPQDSRAAAEIPNATASQAGLTVVQMPPETLSRRTIAREVREHTGREITLRPGAYRAVKLPDSDSLTEESFKLARRRARPSAVIFRAQSP